MTIFKPTSRRRFLQYACAGVTWATLGQDAVAAVTTSDTRNASEKTSAVNREQNAVLSSADKLRMVNILQGTNSDYAFSRGNTLPIIAMPFGMEHWTLQSDVSSEPWFFRANDRRIEGVRCTHQLSPWLNDYGQATFLPFQGEPSVSPSGRASSYRPESAVLLPSYLQLTLLRYRCQMELVPTERGAILRMSFANPGLCGLIVDLPGNDADFSSVHDGSCLDGFTHASKGGVPAGFTAYYALQLSLPITGFQVQNLNGRRIGVLRFATKKDGIVECRIAGSFISQQQAQRNLQRELGQESFSQLHAAADQAWNAELSRIEIDGGADEHKRTFYSCLYRTALFPRIFYEYDAAGNPIHYSAFNRRVEPGVMYADHGYWDVYRAWYPLMSIINPKRLGEILAGWVNAAREGGWLPQFPAPGYRSCMTGSLIDAVFADAVVKGISGFDVEAAYAAMRKHATTPGNPDAGYGRRGLEEYLRYGYIPSDHVKQAAVETLDSAYGDYCLAQIARSLRKNRDAELFAKRAENWRNVFDPQTCFMRGKTSGGKWEEPFHPLAWGGAYVEGCAWQHRFSVPYDVSGLIAAMGGAEAFIKNLDALLQQKPEFDVGTYRHEIHEISEMAAVDFGQYAHSNQPVHHILYLYALAGRRDRTQFCVRRVLDTLYSPEDYPGDEDTGSMAAWYILSALGFYPICPGRPFYVIGAPRFEEARIRFDSGKHTTIHALGGPQNRCYAALPEVNGKRLTTAEIPHATITEGSEIVFRMTEKAQG